jgi:hypothetical protein
LPGGVGSASMALYLTEEDVNALLDAESANEAVEAC